MSKYKMKCLVDTLYLSSAFAGELHTHIKKVIINKKAKRT